MPPKTASELVAPLLLMAMPQVLDPFFHRSVVLLVHHDEDGSFGFIVNRPTGIRVSEILKGMEVTWQGREEVVAHFGGPVRPQLGTVLYAPRKGGTVQDAEDSEVGEDDETAEIIPGVAITQHIGDLSQLAEDPPDRFRLFLGYAGWGSGQLMEEILRNDWLTAPASGDILFSANPEGAWAAALASVGVDPAALPSWTPSSGEETTN